MPDLTLSASSKLVNVSEEANERGEAGIFYTPRTEIDLMCRLSLVDYLANHLGHARKNLLPEIQREHLKNLLLTVDEPREELRGTLVEEYIRWGETKKFHQTATCAARGKDWYRLSPRVPAPLVLPIINKMRLVVGLNMAAAQVDHNCVEVRPKDCFDTDLVAALMLGSFNFLVRHAEGRSYGRMIKVETYEAERLILHDPTCIPSAKANRLVRAFQRIRRKEFQWLIQEMDSKDREEFDRAWLAVHGIDSDPVQRSAIVAIREAVKAICDEMSAQEEDWLEDKPAARYDGNPQDTMKGKRIPR